MKQKLNRARFKKVGQAYHMRIRTARDLAVIPELDEAHWVASGTSTESIHADPELENYIDTDGNKRIMCFEIKDAITWLLDVLKDHSGIEAESSVLKLDSINTDSNDGNSIHAHSINILTLAGNSDAKEISLEQIRSAKAKIEDTPISEAGVVLPEAAESQPLQKFISDLVETLEGKDHPGGEKGINEELLTKFIELAEKRLEWHEEAKLPKDRATSDIMPLGKRTYDAYRAFAAVEKKIDQYFAQCEAVNVNKLVLDRVIPDKEKLKEVDLSDPAAIDEFMKRSPLATPTRDMTLHFGSDLNMYYSEAIEKFRTETANTILDRPAQTLTRKEWLSIKEFLSAHSEWISRKVGGEIEKIGLKKIQEYLDPIYAEQTRKLISESKQTALDLGHIRQIEKLTLYQAYMMNLVNNFVSFPHLYDPEKRAVFEMGTLVIDGRHLNFSVRIDNRKEHIKVAKTSNIFILYVEIMPGKGMKNYEVAVPVTAGGKGNLCVGKRGVFTDLTGFESDAKVLHIIENPISIRETLVAPFQKMGKMLTGKIESMTQTAEKKFDAMGSGKAPVAPVAAKPTTGSMPAGNLLMGGGVALAAISSAFAFVTKTLSGIEPMSILIGVIVAILAIVAPASIIALMKLRSRDLSAILEGAGWAINGRMRLTFKLGRFFTSKPKRPGKDIFSIS